MARSSLLVLVLAAGCSEQFYSDSVPAAEPKVEPPTKEELERWVADYRKGEAEWRGDPKKVADEALRRYLHISIIPWIYDPYRPSAYQLGRREDWGWFVVRYYPFPDGVMHYRVKVCQYEDVWYPVQVSHYKEVTLKHPALED